MRTHECARACMRIQEDHENLLDPILALGLEIYLRRTGRGYSRGPDVHIGNEMYTHMAHATHMERESHTLHVRQNSWASLAVPQRVRHTHYGSSNCGYLANRNKTVCPCKTLHIRFILPLIETVNTQRGWGDGQVVRSIYMLLQRTQGWLPPPTGQFATTCDSSSRELDARSGFRGFLHVVHIKLHKYTGTYTHLKK